MNKQSKEEAFPNDWDLLAKKIKALRFEVDNSIVDSIEETLNKIYHAQFTAGNAVSEVVKTVCKQCNGSGKINIDNRETYNCYKCGGTGFCTQSKQPEQTNAVSDVSDEDIVYVPIPKGETTEAGAVCLDDDKNVLWLKPIKISELVALSKPVLSDEEIKKILLSEMPELKHLIGRGLDKITSWYKAALSKGGASPDELDLVLADLQEQVKVLKEQGTLNRCTYTDAVNDLSITIKEIKEKRKESPMQLGEAERLTKIIKQLYVMYNREVMFPDKLESHWQQFCTENNLK